MLYVEDNPSNVRLVSQLLKQKKNIRLLTAHTAELGIQMAEVEVPDLILLDINLPGMDGYQTLKVLKEKEKFNAIPVIAVTANAMKYQIEKGKEAGFREYITKPINVDNFLKIIDQYLTQG